MSDRMYTLAMWKVKAGHDSEFKEAWQELGRTFRALPNPPAGRGVLIQSVDDPSVYYSFGPWSSGEDIAAMRADPEAQAGISRILELCDEATPAAYKMVSEA